MTKRWRIFLSIHALGVLCLHGCSPQNDTNPQEEIDSYLKLGLHKKALRLTDIQISRSPDAGYFITRYQINRHLGNLDEATNDLFSAASFANRDYYINGNEYSLLTYGLILLHIGDLERAQAIFGIIDARHPNLADRIASYDEEAMKRVIAEGLQVFPQ